MTFGRRHPLAGTEAVTVIAEFVAAEAHSNPGPQRVAVPGDRLHRLDLQVARIFRAQRRPLIAGDRARQHQPAGRIDGPGRDPVVEQRVLLLLGEAVGRRRRLQAARATGRNGQRRDRHRRVLLCAGDRVGCGCCCPFLDRRDRLVEAPGRQVRRIARRTGRRELGGGAGPRRVPVRVLRHQRPEPARKLGLQRVQVGGIAVGADDVRVPGVAHHGDRVADVRIAAAGGAVGDRQRHPGRQSFTLVDVRPDVERLAQLALVPGGERHHRRGRGGREQGSSRPP